MAIHGANLRNISPRSLCRPSCTTACLHVKISKHSPESDCYVTAHLVHVQYPVKQPRTPSSRPDPFLPLPRTQGRALSSAGSYIRGAPVGRNTTRAVSKCPSTIAVINANYSQCHRQTSLTIPAFSSLSAANRYHNAARLRALRRILRNAAWPRSSAIGGSSALNSRHTY